LKLAVGKYFLDKKANSITATFLNNTSNNIKIFTFFIKINNINDEAKWT